MAQTRTNFIGGKRSELLKTELGEKFAAKPTASSNKVIQLSIVIFPEINIVTNAMGTIIFVGFVQYV